VSDIPARRRVPRWVPATLIGVAAVVALTVVALSGRDYDPSTPEGAAQGWVRAVTTDDHEAALTYLDPALGCTLSDFRYVWWSPSAAVRIESISGDASRTVVEVTIKDRQMPVPGDLAGGMREYLVMARHGDRWLLTEVPWPLYSCEGEVDA
jgi:hypothetical protein